MIRSILSPLAGIVLLAGPALAQDTGAASGTITLYTSQPAEQMDLVIEAFNVDHPEVTVEVFRTGTTELMSKLQAEFTAGATPADVLLIADAVAMTQLKDAFIPTRRLLLRDCPPASSIPT